MTIDVKFTISGDAKDAIDAAKKAAKAINGIDKESKKAAAGAKQLNSVLNGIKSTAAGLFGAYTFANFAKGVINTNRSLEMLRAQLDSVTGSAEEGARAFDSINRFAIDTPFQIEGLTRAFIGLKNYGITPTKEIMEAVTNQASKLGASQETLSGIVTALGQSWSKGKLQAEEMLQLAERGVPVYDLLSKALHVSTTELAEMSSKGELTRETISLLIEKMGEMASGSNARAMDTLNGKISNLSDAWHQFEDTLLNDRSEGLIKSIVQSAANSINTLRRNLSNGLDDQIAHAEARLKTFNSLGAVGKFAADFSGYDPGIEQNRIDNLKRQKARQDALAEESIIKQKSADAIAQTMQWLDEIDKTTAKSAEENSKRRTKAADSESKARARAYNAARAAAAQTIDDLNFELAALKLSENERRKQALIRQETANTTQAERENIIALIEAIDAETEAQKRQSAAWAQAIEDANALYDLKKRIAEFSNSNSITQSGFSSLMGDIQDTGAELGLNEEELKALYDRAGKAFNDGYIEPAKKGLSEMDEFSKQAARNMQDAFADFLFDPFDKGMDGMLSGFLTTIRRMAAEAASAQIMESLFGKQGGSGGFNWGGLVGSVVSGIGGAVSSGVSSGGGNSAGFASSMDGLFKNFQLTASANGNVMTAAGPMPLKRYSKGGIANSPQLSLFGEGRQNEAYVPLPDGRSIPVTLSGGNGGNTYNVSINVQSDGDSPGKMGEQIGEAFVRAIARQEINSAARPGNALNKTTSFA